MEDVCKVCEGSLKQTNHLRTLMSSLTKGMYIMYSQLDKTLTSRCRTRHYSHTLAAIQGPQVYVRCRMGT